MMDSNDRRAFDIAVRSHTADAVALLAGLGIGRAWMIGHS